MQQQIKVKIIEINSRMQLMVVVGEVMSSTVCFHNCRAQTTKTFTEETTLDPVG
jgi:hypothetical protein